MLRRLDHPAYNATIFASSTVVRLLLLGNRIGFLNVYLWQLSGEKVSTILGFVITSQVNRLMCQFAK